MAKRGRPFNREELTERIMIRLTKKESLRFREEAFHLGRPISTHLRFLLLGLRKKP